MGSRSKGSDGRIYGNKTVYVKDWDKWNEAVEFAKAQNMSISDVIALALERLMTPPEVELDKLNRIRAIIEE